MSGRVLTADELAVMLVRGHHGWIGANDWKNIRATLRAQYVEIAAYRAVAVAAKGYLNKKHGRGPLDAALSAIPEEPGEAAGPVTGGER